MLNEFRPLLANRDLAVSLAGRCASVFGDEVAVVALTLRLQAAGAPPYQVALLLAAGLVPVLALARVVGRVADSADSRRVLVSAALAQACCCVPLIFADGVPAVVALVALLGVGTAFSQATWQALIPRIAGEENIGAATAIQQAAFTLAGIAAPAVAGLLSGAFGTRVPLTIDAVSFAVLAGAALIVRTRRAGGRARGAERDRGGWAVLRGDPLLAPLVLGLAAFLLLAMMLNVVGVFLVRETLHASAAWYGALEATWMLGVVAGALAAGRVSAERGRVRATLAGAGVIALVFLGYGLAPTVLLLVPLSVFGGAGNGLVSVCVGTLVMTRTEERVRGRVSAAMGAVLNGAGVASLAAGGALGALLAPRQVFLLAGGLAALATVVTWARAMPAAALAPSASPGPRVSATSD